MLRLDVREALDLKRAAQRAIVNVDDDGAFFTQSFLQTKGFCSIIVEGDFRDPNNYVSALCSMRKIRTVKCGSVNENNNECYVISADHSDLRTVREIYPDPSYFITNDFEDFVVLSDSDYYWGLAAARRDLERIFATPLDVILDEYRDDIQPFLESSDAHDVKIGTMLNRFLQICRMSMSTAR